MPHTHTPIRPDSQLSKITGLSKRTGTIENFATFKTNREDIFLERYCFVGSVTISPSVTSNPFRPLRPFFLTTVNLNLILGDTSRCGGVHMWSTFFDASPGGVAHFRDSVHCLTKKRKRNRKRLVATNAEGERVSPYPFFGVFKSWKGVFENSFSENVSVLPSVRARAHSTRKNDLSYEEK